MGERYCEDWKGVIEGRGLCEVKDSKSRELFWSFIEILFLELSSGSWLPIFFSNGGVRLT